MRIRRRSLHHQTPRDLGASEARRLELLIFDYEMARDDERISINAQTTILGVAVALIALLIGALTQECSFGMKLPADCIDVPDLALASTPLLPLAMLAFTQMIGEIGTLRSYYMRGLEAELGAYIKAPIAALGEVRPLSYMGLATELMSLRRGRAGYRLLANFILFSIVLVFGGITLYIGIKVGSRPIKVAMIVVYGTAFIALFHEMVASTIGGRRLFESAARKFLSGNSYIGLPKVGHDPHNDSIAAIGQSSMSGIESVGPSRKPEVEINESKRSLLSYLFLPRPEDLIKWPIAPIVFLLTAWSTGNWERWPQFLLLWLILEYLVYESRYQWNDVRGLDEDQVHAEHQSRARLPIKGSPDEQRRDIVTSVSLGLTRLALAILTGWAFQLTTEVLVLIVAVYAIAIPYEVLRAHKEINTPFRPTPTTITIWLLVGFGYAIRAGLGFTLANLPIFIRAGAIGTVYFIAFGIMFVLLTWVLDATSYCRCDKGDTWYALPALTLKPHLAALLRYVDITPSDARNAPVGSLPKEPIDRENDPAYCGSRKVLEKSTFRESSRAPWNWAMLSSMGMGAVLGIDLAGPRASGPLVYVVAVAVSLAGGILLTSTGIKKNLLNLFIVGGFLSLIAIIAESKLPILAAIPWLATSVTYLNFRYSSYRDLKEFGRTAVKGIKIIPSILLRLLVGRATWDKFSFRGPYGPRS